MAWSKASARSCTQRTELSKTKRLVVGEGLSARVFEYRFVDKVRTWYGPRDQLGSMFGGGLPMKSKSLSRF